VGSELPVSVLSGARPRLDFNLHCMLGLRPRLKTRPSLLDLIHKKNIDEISVSVDQATAVLEADVEPHRIPLPASPLISPHREVPSQPPQLPPPRITLQEDSDEEARDEEEAKMPPVSFAVLRRAIGCG
jgi:V-type H+-transporting ATPase subunit A